MRSHHNSKQRNYEHQTTAKELLRRDINKYRHVFYSPRAALLCLFSFRFCAGENDLDDLKKRFRWGTFLTSKEEGCEQWHIGEKASISHSKVESGSYIESTASVGHSVVRNKGVVESG